MVIEGWYRGAGVGLDTSEARDLGSGMCLAMWHMCAVTVGTVPVVNGAAVGEVDTEGVVHTDVGGVIIRLSYQSLRSIVRQHHRRQLL